MIVQIYLIPFENMIVKSLSKDGVETVLTVSKNNDNCSYVIVDDNNALRFYDDNGLVQILSDYSNRSMIFNPLTNMWVEYDYRKVISFEQLALYDEYIKEYVHDNVKTVQTSTIDSLFE